MKHLAKKYYILSLINFKNLRRFVIYLYNNLSISEKLNFKGIEFHITVKTCHMIETKTNFDINVFRYVSKHIYFIYILKNYLKSILNCY